MSIKTQDFSYQARGKSYRGYLAQPDNGAAPRAGILIAPEWWGVSEHVKTCAEKLAREGYTALALDVYGDGVLTTEASQANAWMTAVLEDEDALPSCTAAALAALADLADVDADKIAAIGFCFGGKVALDMARRGQKIVAAVSFHGTLTPSVPARAEVLTAELLIEHGEKDSLITLDDLAAFRAEMDAAGAKYHIDILPNARHGFTNPEATANGEKNGVDLAYDAEATAAAWANMLTFLRRVL